MTRTYGTGTISQVKDKPGVYRMRVFTEDAISGQRKQVSKTIHTKTRPGEKWLGNQLAAFKKEVEGKKTTGESMTFGKVLDDWLADLKREGRAKTTLETYGYHIEGKIRPALGALPLATIDPARIRAFMGSLKGSVRTQRLTHAILRGALSFAVMSDWIVVNPASRVKPPKVAPRDDNALTPEQVAELITAASAKDPAMGMAIALTAVTGCRRGEVIGLRWSDVDWEAETLRVERAWVTGTGGQHLTTTKTKEKRTVSVKGYGISVLRTWQAHQLAAYGQTGEWLLSDSDGSEPLQAKVVTLTFTALAKDHGLTAHFHDLRHFAATQLVGLGVDVKSAAGRLGHTPKVMLDTYAHGIAERDAAASVALGDVLTKALEGRRAT